MKKLKRLSILSIALMSTLIVSCGEDISTSTTNDDLTSSDTGTDNSNTTSDESFGYEDDFSYYLETKINSNKQLKVFKSFGSDALDKNKLVIATAIQGFFSREDGQYYLQYQENDEWVNDLKDNYGFSFVDTTLDEMLSNFKENFTSKYVLYD